MIRNSRYVITALSAVLLLGTTAMPAMAKSGNWNAHADKKRVYPAYQTVATPRQIPVIRSNGHINQNYPLLAQNKISPAEAKSIARRHVKGGEAVDISRNGNTYRVRVIAKNGKVVDVFIDANTGRVKR